MSCDFMRLLLFFDLPMTTKKERRVYAAFRKYLISKGYIMLQFSVYVRIFANREAVSNHISIIKKNVPKEGQIRIMTVTEKQYSKMEIILGGISRQEDIITSDPLIVV
jgi:CRISPR-associated protein Cas2